MGFLPRVLYIVGGIFGLVAGVKLYFKRAEDKRVQALIDAAFEIPEVVANVLGGLPKEEIFANRCLGKVWREAAFWPLRSHGFVLLLPEEPVQEDFKEFQDKFSTECYLPINSQVIAVGPTPVGGRDKVLALQREYSKFIVGLEVLDVPVNFQFQWNELGEFPRLESLDVSNTPQWGLEGEREISSREFLDHECGVYYPRPDPTAKFLSKLARGKYFKKFNTDISIGSGRDEGDLPLQLTSLTVYMSLPIPEQSCVLTPLPNLKELAMHIICGFYFGIYVHEDESEPGTALRNVKRVKNILEKFSPHLESLVIRWSLDEEHLKLLPFLRMPRMEKLRELNLDCLPIESADGSPLPQVLPEMKFLQLNGERSLVFGNMAAFGHGENRRLEELHLCFQDKKLGGNWEAFPQLILNFKALKSLHIIFPFASPRDSPHISPGLFGAFMDVPSLNKLLLRGPVEVDPALIQEWTNAGREIEIELTE